MRQPFYRAIRLLYLPVLLIGPAWSVTQAAGTKSVDYRRDVLRFEVTADAASAGVWSPPRRWSASGSVRFRA